jgi:serine protease Do
MCNNSLCKFLVFICFLIVFSFTGIGCAIVSDVSGDVIQFNVSEDVGYVAKYVSPAVVGVGGISSGGNLSVGSGVCVTQNGLILTNSHVVNGCSKINIYLSDGSEVLAKLVYEDTVGDLAILKSSKSLPYLLVGNSDEMSVGDEILAVGTPLSLQLTHTFTKGIVSAMNRTLSISSGSGDGYMQNLIQHDASLNPGNSGGPLLNSKGEVIGINTLKISSGEGIGFAIPSKSFKSLLGSFVENINYEVPKIGAFGLDSSIAKFNKKTELAKGFYIIDLSDVGVLKKCGVSEGSVITKINNEPINNTLDLKNQLYKIKQNDVVVFEIYKDGVYKNIGIKFN